MNIFPFEILIFVSILFIRCVNKKKYLARTCEDREGLMAYLKENNIGTRTFYPALHAEPAYAYKASYPNAEYVAQKGLWLPSSITLTDGMIIEICNRIRDFYNKK